MSTNEETEAEVLVAAGQPLQRMTLRVPPLQRGQVLVDLEFAGVCHSQLNEVRGLRGPDRYVPHTLGHEGSGVVRTTGEGVTKVKAGDRVVLTWIKGTGLDAAGPTYESPIGKVNSGAISTFMRTAVIAENRMVRIPDAMPMREAALLGCAIPTGAGVVVNNAQLRAGETIAIFGIGGVGSSAVLGAVSAGASRIFAVDKSPDKLRRAMDLGATDQIHASADVVESIMRATGDKGVDCAVEATGSASAMESAFKVVRAGGGRCVIAGNLPAGAMMSIDPMDLIRGKRISGTWGGETDPDRDIPEYAAIFIAGRLPLEKLITHEFEFGEINRALDELQAGSVGRALVRMN